MASFIGNALDQLAKRLGKGTQEVQHESRVRDVYWQNDTFSIESTVADTLSNLACSGFSLPVSGESERALKMNDIAADFVMHDIRTAISMGFATGDCLVVPIFDGRGFVNAVIGRDDFRIINMLGGKPTSVAYVADSFRDEHSLYQLIQAMELIDLGESTACRYSLAIARNGNLAGDNLSQFPQWADFEREWYVPNVDRLLLGRFKCFTKDKGFPNSLYGLPLCYGASQHIREIHYILDQMHNEFEMSEKAVMAPRHMFEKDNQGALVMPRGRDRVFMSIRGDSVDDNTIHEWAPTIQFTPYEQALEVAKRELEQSIGVDSGIISSPDSSTNYANVDNVRKSMRKTQSFINRTRDEADGMIDDLLYTWDVLLNFYGFPMGDYDHTHKWSDDYINTFSDQRDALVQGYAMGATDALDYRIFALNESPDVARARIEEIQAGRLVNVVAEE